MNIDNISSNKSAGGWHKRYRHHSSALNCDMTFAIFLPPQVEEGKKVPVLYWLSGLTCTDENFMQKAGAFNKAAELGLAIVAPDTSPRGEDVANDEGYDLGQGAGFYLNATQAPWDKHFHMYDYILDELPSLIEQTFPVTAQKSISGHSMGGHGALTIGIRNSSGYKSISAFSPICHPMQCDWGKKAFSHYLGSDETSWMQYDASHLIEQPSKGAHKSIPIKVDFGLADEFLEKQLLPDALIRAAEKSHTPIEVQQHDGYDHSYYFIASFIDEHLTFHHKHLTA